MAQTIHSVLKKALSVVPEEHHPSELHLGGPRPQCPMDAMVNIALEGVALLAKRDGGDDVRDAMLDALIELRVPLNASGMRRAEYLELNSDRIAALKRNTDDAKGDSLSQRAARRAKRAAYHEARDKAPSVTTLVSSVAAMVTTALFDDGQHERLTHYLLELDQRLMCGEASKALGKPVTRTLHRAAGGVAIGELVVELGPPAPAHERIVARVKIKRRWHVFSGANIKELLARLPDGHFAAVADSVLARAT